MTRQAHIRKARKAIEKMVKMVKMGKTSRYWYGHRFGINRSMFEPTEKIESVDNCCYALMGIKRETDPIRKMVKA